jgi:SagB-type dehydrogenase family enzyme
VTVETVRLPRPARDGKVALEKALATRRSIREFADEPLTPRELSCLLWATQGITGPEGLRASPSAGALYPLETYVATAEGLFHYEPADHTLTKNSDEDLRRAMHRAALTQASIPAAPAVVILAAVYARTERRYGKTSGRRYVLIEIGHAAENLLLQATALGLGAVPIGAFHEARMHQALGLPRGHVPLYLIPVGRPRSG